MTRFLLVLAAALVAAPAALADGIAPFATQGGPGVLAPDGSTRIVALAHGAGTKVVRRDADGGVISTVLPGAWGVPVSTYANTGEGVSADGKTLVLADVVHSWPHVRSSFLFLDPRTLAVRDRVTLHGDFAYDALSPDARRLYLIQHIDDNDTTRYVVRAVDTRTLRLLPGRIADRTQRGWVMEGYPLNRVTSKDGRWVYTLYGNPKNVPFVHALDTVRGVAHCVGLPLRSGDQTNLVLALRDGGRTLAVHWLSGRPWYTVDTATWRLTPDRGGGFAWWWILVAASVAGAATILVAHGRRAAAIRRGSARGDRGPARLGPWLPLTRPR
jgi:hypothetical protein